MGLRDARASATAAAFSCDCVQFFPSSIGPKRPPQVYGMSSCTTLAQLELTTRVCNRTYPLLPPLPRLLSCVCVQILMRGPMTLSDWMRTCLGHPQLGYYMSGDVFGRRGDFTTSPEISQLFGELVGIWLVAYVQQAHPSPQQPVALLELGPGRGTLAQDVLRVFARFPALSQRVRSLQLVETSPALRRIQASTLLCQPNEQEQEGHALTQAQCGSGSAIPGLPVHWHDRISDVPTGSSPAVTLLLAHELFDALPVHQLVWTGQGKGWRERLVDVDFTPPLLPAMPPASTSAGGLAMLAAQAQGQPPASCLLGPTGQPLQASQPSAQLDETSSRSHDMQDARFKLVLANGVTPAAAAYAQWLTNKRRVQSERRQQQQKADAQARESDAEGARLAEGTVAEFSPASIDLGRQIATRLSITGGCALLMDYGYSDGLGVDGRARGDRGSAAQGAGFWTLRGIQKHQFVDFLSKPGAVDLSVDVDFSALAAAMEAVDRDVQASQEGPQGQYRVKAWGPITQGTFLQRMGLGARLQRLLSSPSASKDPSVQQRLLGEAERLAHPEQMGSVYKVMAVTAGPAVGSGDSTAGTALSPPAAFE